MLSSHRLKRQFGFHFKRNRQTDVTIYVLSICPDRYLRHRRLLIQLMYFGSKMLLARDQKSKQRTEIFLKAGRNMEQSTEFGAINQNSKPNFEGTGWAREMSIWLQFVTELTRHRASHSHRAREPWLRNPICDPCDTLLCDIYIFYPSRHRTFILIYCCQSYSFRPDQAHLYV